MTSFTWILKIGTSAYYQGKSMVIPFKRVSEGFLGDQWLEHLAYAKKHNLVEVYCPTFDAPHESKIVDVIDIVEYELTQHQRTMKIVIQDLSTDGNDEEANWVQLNLTYLIQNFSHMTSTFFARQILDTTHSFCVNKSWNSHGAQVGTAICKLGCILAAFEGTAQKPLLSNHFPETIP